MHSSLPAPLPSPLTAVCALTHTHTHTQSAHILSVPLSGNVCLIVHLRNTNFRLIGLSRSARVHVSILGTIHGAFLRAQGLHVRSGVHRATVFSACLNQKHDMFILCLKDVQRRKKGGIKCKTGQESPLPHVAHTQYRWYFLSIYLWPRGACCVCLWRCLYLITFKYAFHSTAD